MNRRSLILLLLCEAVAAFLICTPCRAQDTADPQKPEADPAAAAETPAEPVPPQPVAFPDIVTKAEDTATYLKTVATNLATDDSEATAPSGLGSRLDRRENLDASLLKERPTFESLRDSEAEWSLINKQLEIAKAVLSDRANMLQSTLDKIEDLEASWETTRDAPATQETPPEVTARIGTILEQLKSTRAKVIAARRDVLMLQEKVSRQDKRAAAGLAVIDEARATTVGELFIPLSEPLWKVNFLTDVRAGLTSEVPSAFLAQWYVLLDYLDAHRGQLLAHAAILFILLIAFATAARRVKGWARVDPSFETSAFIFDFPYSSAIILTAVIGFYLYPLTPPPLRLLLGAVAIILSVRILRPPLQRPLWPALNALVVFFFINRLCDLTARVPLIERLLFLAEMLGGLLFFLWILRSRLSRAKSENERDLIIRLMRIATLALAFCFSFAFLADCFGFVTLARLVGNGAIVSALVAVIIHALIRILDGIVIFALRARPLRRLGMVKRHRTLIETRCERLIRFLGTLAWVLGALEIFSLLTPVLSVLKSIFTTALTVRDFSVSLWDFVLFGGAIYASILISRLIRFVLKEEVYPHARLPRGVPFAVSTIVHYALILVGFFIALGLAGIDLTRITLLLGALGVGIGLGLQSIVNNFVSGLILLFERPVNVGDVVDVNNQVGELRRIGLRASVLRTPDGSEIIVPNGELISNQVTNWTLTDQQRRLEIPVGVAYGTDPEHVQQLLLSVADGHEDILKEPEPQALFTAFGESSLDFILRAWTNDHQRWPQIRSQLSIAIYRVLEKENIAIPFPQRDIHVVSVPSKAEDEPGEAGAPED